MTQHFEKKYSNIWGKNTLSKLLQIKKNLNSHYIRINSSKTTQQEVEEFLKKNRIIYNTTSLPNCIEIKKSFFNLSSAPLSLSGKIYLQEFSSQLPIHCLNWDSIKKSNKPLRILDMCASPGSKTTQIADVLNYYNSNYHIIALDSEQKRITKLINNLQKQQIQNIEVFQIDAQDFTSSKQFDIILLDAPCSGNLIEDNNWLKKRNQQGIEQNASLQKKLLKKAYSLLKNNGILLYSTCSMEVEENEMNMDWFLHNYKVEMLEPSIKLPFSTTPLKEYKNKKFSAEINKTIRLMPLTSKTQGFYVAILRKL